MSIAPKSVLDAGCGEGWLVGALHNFGIDALGIDALPEFINRARQAYAGRFKVASYQDLSQRYLNECFDAVVCNFSLLGNESVSCLFRQIPSLLNSGGMLIVQTLHPLAACGDLPYRDGWRPGSWQGFNERFKDPAPWYFRTLESWRALFQESGLELFETREPLHPETLQPASVIFMATCRSDAHWR
ncbi:class I SAM-dependent methyltransferase [Methylomonas sp. SURF-2]|uniref:Class I SAM-dependent methyltransferase n=1 Tax=Methylomonas subterranea TaxID=2952225 RepID=A0ABT1TDF5_9GAMM|nr:class I SAM-dependent methyltransferase [Methylomonas sp. SURF-2]MCQ8103142.1 class I SAM-dependent methyltransferase [Methylomonas sp. SURF-2]